MAGYEEVQQTLVVDEEAGPPLFVGRTPCSRGFRSVGLAITIGIAIVCVGSVGLARHHTPVLRSEGIVRFEEDMSVEQYIERAKLAEQVERYEDMVSAMKAVVTMKPEGLSEEERNMFSVAYKNVVGAKRSSWRIISSIEEAKKSAAAGTYLKEIEGELLTTADHLLGLLDDSLIPSAKAKVADSQMPEDVEAQVFFLKMKGDYWRYKAEVLTGADKDNAATVAGAAYKEALDVAEQDLPATHPIRLGLVLNYSVFLHEIMNEPTNACTVAKKAFDDAIAELDSMGEDAYKDSTLIIQLLRDNLTLWTAEDQDDT